MKDLKKNLLHFFKLTAPFIVIIGVVFSFYWKVFIKGYVPLPGDFIVGVYHPWIDYKWPGFPAGVPVKNPIMADVVSFSFPMRMLAVDLMKSGQLPLWNPYILMGTPLLANFQSAPFSITNIVYFVFDRLTAWSVQIILQHLFAAFFTFLLLRHWKVSKNGAILGGIVFAFSGFNLIWSQWNAHTLTASFMPLIVLFADKFLLEKKITYAFLFSISLGIQMLCGYPQLVLYTILIIGLLWLIRGKSVTSTLLFLIFAALGLSLGAVQILPGLELLKFSQRAIEPHPFEWAFLPFQKIITFIAPDFFGNHATGNYWGPQDYTSNTGFVGIVGLLLAILAIHKFRERKEILFGGLIVIFSLFLSFPTFISIFLWKSGVLGFNAAAAHRALVLFNLGIALLCGFGFDNVKLERVKSKMGALLVSFFTLLVFGLYSIQVHQLVGLKNLVLPAGILLISTLIVLLKPKLKILLILLSIVELFYFGWKFTPFSKRELVFPVTPIISFLQSQTKPFRTTGDHVIPINFRMNYGIETVEGYDAIYPVSSSEFINKINNNQNVFRRYAIVDNDTSLLLDLVNTRYYLALKDDMNLKRFDPKRFKKVFEDRSIIIFESKSTLPRAFLVNQKKEEQYKIYKETGSVIGINAAADDDLFVSDTYYPGWKAYLDGKELEIRKTSNSFRLVRVAKGAHEVKFVYEPESFFNGLKISVLSFVILVGLLIFFKLYFRKFI